MSGVAVAVGRCVTTGLDLHHHWYEYLVVEVAVGRCVTTGLDGVIKMSRVGVEVLGAAGVSVYMTDLVGVALGVPIRLTMPAS
jgi:hypothetical protein